MFSFNEFLQRIGLDPARTRLLRHKKGESVAAWRRGRERAFGCFASFQTLNNSPYNGNVTHACHFLPGPGRPDQSHTALFLGTTRILGRWRWDGNRMPAIQDAEVIEGERGNEDVEAFDLEWIEPGHDYSERMLIHWGRNARTWSQWAGEQPKDILEIRLTAQEPPFPGFSAFLSRISEIQKFPASWLNALSSVGGIYLLVADNGDQYVGSAAGQDGFLGRWCHYAANGNGGNRLLIERGHRDYQISILEVASPDMAAADIIRRESFWKDKLGARAHGLNAN
ncbi:GIY-YIG nuclease family protein [Leisingera caerulea]|uniref:GIY-YIG nuclease family protein n=1 Tax=Leisingera caerulea TaxID=506591 RepID=UPI0003F6178B|nr:GIY-YIG nuclease family protein [Leisingera caerulea]